MPSFLCVKLTFGGIALAPKKNDAAYTDKTVCAFFLLFLLFSAFYLLVLHKKILLRCFCAKIKQKF